MSRSTQGHHLNKLGSTRAPDAAHQVSRSSAIWFWRRRCFKVFTIYGHGGHLGHVTWTVWAIFVPSSEGGAIWNLASIGPVVSEEKMFENVDIHTHINTYTHTDYRAYLHYKLTNEPKGSGELTNSDSWWPDVLSIGKTQNVLEIIVYNLAHPAEAFLCWRHAEIFNGLLRVNDVRLFCDFYVFKTAS